MADSEDRSTTGGGTIDAAAIPFKLSSIDQRIHFNDTLNLGQVSLI
jgi:hypothetical protein